MTRSDAEFLVSRSRIHLSSHEADGRSTACIHERDARLCVALSHNTCEHVVRLELWQSLRCLVYHNSSVRRTSCSTCHAEWAPVLNGTCVALCSILAVPEVQEFAKLGVEEGVFVSPEMSSGPA